MRSNGKLHSSHWWQTLPSKTLWEPRASLILWAFLPAVHDNRWQSPFEYFASPPWPKYLIDMATTVRFLHLAVVPIQASVRPANEFNLLVFAVLVAKPETIESINGVFNPLNHMVYNPPASFLSSFHNPSQFQVKVHPDEQNKVRKWILVVAENPYSEPRQVFILEAK